jgi:exosome complex component RRP43
LWFHAGAVSTADGSALVKIGNTTMLAGVKLEVMVPSQETPDQGSITVDFQMPPICSPLVRPGRPVETASVISEQLSNVLTRVGQFE